MNILKLDSVFICTALVLTKVVWTQSEKSSSQPFSVLVHISVSLKEAGGWCQVPISLFRALDQSGSLFFLSDDIMNL